MAYYSNTLHSKYSGHQPKKNSIISLVTESFDLEVIFCDYICKECSKYHKSHKLYQNNKYLISKDDFEKIMNNFKSAKNNLNKNLTYITNKINFLNPNYKI